MNNENHKKETPLSIDKRTVTRVVHEERERSGEEVVSAVHVDGTIILGARVS